MIRVLDDSAVNQNDVPPLPQLWVVEAETVHESGICFLVIIPMTRGQQSWIDDCRALFEILTSASRYDCVCIKHGLHRSCKLRRILTVEWRDHEHQTKPVDCDLETFVAGSSLYLSGLRNTIFGDAFS